MIQLQIKMVEKIFSECFLMMVMSRRWWYEIIIQIRNDIELTSITSTSLSSGIGINDDNGNSLV